MVVTAGAAQFACIELHVAEGVSRVHVHTGVVTQDKATGDRVCHHAATISQAEAVYEYLVSLVRLWTS